MSCRYYLKKLNSLIDVLDVVNARFVIVGFEKAGFIFKPMLRDGISHGGGGKDHGGATMAEIEIPWIVTGPGVVAGKVITAPVDTYDTAATVAYVLSVETPDCWIARPVKAAFSK